MKFKLSILDILFARLSVFLFYFLEYGEKHIKAVKFEVELKSLNNVRENGVIPKLTRSINRPMSKLQDEFSKNQKIL